MNHKNLMNKRPEATQWWWQLPIEKRKKLAEKYFLVEFEMYGFDFINTSNYKIEEIYKNETLCPNIEAAQRKARLKYAMKQKIR